MYSSLNLSGWAGQILDDYLISGVTTGSVVSWLESNVGKLNILIKENFYVEYISGSGEILPEMNQPATSIYTKIYECEYLSRQAKQAAYLGISDWVELEGADQGKIRKVSKTEASKELRNLAKDCKSELTDLIKDYKAQVSGEYLIPSQVLTSFCCGVTSDELN
jgi:hypothetical protein